jgi:hypothetical protein
MIEDDFYSTIKLKSGEEIFARVAASEEDNRTMLLVHSPITIGEIKGRKGTVGYKVEPWLKTTTDDMFIINMNDVLTLSESKDIDMILMYEDYVNQSHKDHTNRSKINRRMGYLGNVTDTKASLEKIFKSS